MAGADRVEGCLLGNGERTGNCDLVTRRAQHVHARRRSRPRLLATSTTIVKTVDLLQPAARPPAPPLCRRTGLHRLFGLAIRTRSRRASPRSEQRNDELWEVPYLPIDPADLGRSYEAVIRVNSQSGKGGVAWVLEQDKGLQAAQAAAGRLQPPRPGARRPDQPRAQSPTTSGRLFERDLSAWRGDQRFALLDYRRDARAAAASGAFSSAASADGQARSGRSRARQRPDLQRAGGAARRTAGSTSRSSTTASTRSATARDAQAAAYVECRLPDGRTLFGCGLDTDVATASVKSLLSVANAAAAGSAAKAA